MSIRQSKRNIIAAMMPEVRKPRVVTMTTRVATFAMFSMVLVVTGRDLAEAVVIEPAHRQVAQVLGDFDAFVGAGSVAAYGLQHGGLHVDGDGHDQRNHDDSKARPECRSW